MRNRYRGLSARGQLAVQNEVRRQTRIIFSCITVVLIVGYIFIIKPLIGA